MDIPTYIYIMFTYLLIYIFIYRDSLIGITESRILNSKLDVHVESQASFRHPDSSYTTPKKIRIIMP